MEIQTRINEQFTQENLAVTMAKYQLYYQIALGVFVNDTSFDEKEVSKRLEEYELDIEPLHVLNTMKTILENFYDQDDFQAIFDDNIKVNSMIHALKDFVQKSEDVTNKEQMHDTYYEQIMNDEFYTVKMQIHFDSELPDRITEWKKVVTEESALELKTSAYKLLVK